MPKRCSNASRCSGGSAAEAERQKRSARGLFARRHRPFEQVRDHRRHDVDPGAARLRGLLPEARGREARRHREAAAVRERRQHRHRERVDVIERQHREHAVVRRQAVLGADRLRVRGEVGLRQHHALRHAGRARGVHQQREVVGPRHRRRVGRGSVGLALVERRIGVRDDDRHRPIDRREQRTHARFPLGRDEDELAVGMREHMAHLLRLRQQVDRVDAAAGVHRAEQQAQRLQAVRHHQRDGVARTDAVRAQQRADRAAGTRAARRR